MPGSRSIFIIKFVVFIHIMTVEKVLERFSAKPVHVILFDDLGEADRLTLKKELHVCDKEWMLDGMMDIEIYQIDEKGNIFIIKTRTHHKENVITGSYCIVRGDLQEIVGEILKNYSTSSCEVPGD